MNLQARKEILERLGQVITAGSQEWEAAKERASYENAWFTPEFVDLSSHNIATRFLSAENLQAVIDKYKIPAENNKPKKVGIVMAGNIPLVGFHEEPQCAAVCPVDCCVPDEMYRETVDELLAKKERMHL